MVLRDEAMGHLRSGAKTFSAWPQQLVSKPQQRIIRRIAMSLNVQLSARAADCGLAGEPDVFTRRTTIDGSAGRV